MIDYVLTPADVLTITVDTPAQVFVSTRPKVRLFSRRRRDTIQALRQEVANLRIELAAADAVNGWLAEQVGEEQ